MSIKDRKRIDIVSIKLCREKSILYEPRTISKPLDAVNLLKQFLDSLDREEFIVISLDTKNQPTSINICSRGSLNSCIVAPREVFKPAILSNANSILVGHNHPSGITKPSTEDISLTERLKEAGRILGIELIDHIIIGGENYYSFKENQQL